VDDGRQVWRISVVIEATAEQQDAAVEAIDRTLCADENHAGFCPVPWTLLRCRRDDLDPDERAWQGDFDDERCRAGGAGAPGG
jgi:hypothetical protein